MQKNSDTELSRLITSLSKEVDVIPSESNKIPAFKLAKRRLNNRKRQIHKTGYGMDPKDKEKNHDKTSEKRIECTDTESDSENSSVDDERVFFVKAWENETNEKTESQITNREWLESEINTFCNAIDRQLGKPIKVSNSNNIIYPNTSRVNLEESLDSKNRIRFSSNNKSQEGVNKSLAEQQVGNNGFIGESDLEKNRQKKLFIKQLKAIFDNKKGNEALIEKIMDKSSIEKLKNHSELYKINFMSLLERYNKVKRAHSMVVPRMQMVEIQNKILFEIISKIYSDDEHNLDLLKEFIEIKSFCIHSIMKLGSDLGENYVNILNNVINANTTSEIRPWAKILSGTFNHYEMKVDETLIHDLNTLYSISKMSQGI